MLKTHAAETEIQKEGDMHQETWRQLPECQTLPQADTITALPCEYREAQSRTPT